MPTDDREFERAEKAAARRLVEEWNAAHRPGARAFYRQDNGTLLATRTTSIAYLMGDGTAVILIDGRAGCHLLQRLMPCPERERTGP